MRIIKALRQLFGLTLADELDAACEVYARQIIQLEEQVTRNNFALAALYENVRRCKVQAHDLRRMEPQPVALADKDVRRMWRKLLTTQAKGDE